MRQENGRFLGAALLLVSQLACAAPIERPSNTNTDRSVEITAPGETSREELWAQLRRQSRIDRAQLVRQISSGSIPEEELIALDISLKPVTSVDLEHAIKRFKDFLNTKHDQDFWEGLETLRIVDEDSLQLYLEKTDFRNGVFAENVHWLNIQYERAKPKPHFDVTIFEDNSQEEGYTKRTTIDGYVNADGLFIQPTPTGVKLTLSQQFDIARKLISPDIQVSWYTVLQEELFSRTVNLESSAGRSLPQNLVRGIQSKLDPETPVDPRSIKTTKRDWPSVRGKGEYKGMLVEVWIDENGFFKLSLHEK